MEYCLDNGTLSVRVSSLGGELQSVKKDGKEYLFVADRMHPDINLIDNFDEEALKLLLLSKEEDVETNTYKVEKDQDIIQKIVIDMYA